MYPKHSCIRKIKVNNLGMMVQKFKQWTPPRNWESEEDTVTPIFEEVEICLIRKSCKKMIISNAGS